MAIALTVILLIAWAPYFFAGKTLLSSSSQVQSIYPTGAGPTADPGNHVLPGLDPGAPGWANEPWLAAEHRLILDDHVLPMWNPYDGYGTPFAASMQPAPFYPLSAAAAIYPGPWTYNFLVIGRLFVVGFGCALFVRMFAGFTPALVAGICAAFSGYFLLYLNIGHVAVEAMLPWTLLGVELSVRRAAPGSAAVLAIAWALTLLGGMPESAALAGLVIASYAVFRVVISRADGPLLPRCAAIVAGLTVGSLIAGIVVVPFLEYLGRDFDVHQARNTGFTPGLGFDPFTAQYLLTDFSPLAFGPPWNNLLTGFSGASGARGAPGVFAIFCAVVAAVAAISSYRRRVLIDRVVLFMVVVVAVFEAKRFGLPLVNWVGGLPVLQLIEFSKYDEALIAVLCACLAGLGVASILERGAPARTVGLAAVLVLAAFTWLYSRVNVLESIPHAVLHYAAIGFALTMFAATAGGLLYVARYGRPRRTGMLLVGLACIEGTCAFLVPLRYIADKPSSDSRNPFAGAPYIAYLQHATQTDGGRIVATGGDLFPDWASAFGLYDTRDLDAMYPQRYLPFVAAFLFPQNTPDPLTSGDGRDRFTGMRAIDVGSPLVRRWMALSSIEYLASVRPPSAVQNEVLSALWAETSPTVPAAFSSAVHLSNVRIGNTFEATLFEHPPYSDVRYTSTVERRSPWFAVDLMLDPAVWNTCGGPVTFQIDALDGGGGIVTSVARTIDPKHNVADRRFIRETLDLRKLIGRSVTLRFATSVPPPGDTCAAWANWGEPHWTPRQDLKPFHAVPLAGFAWVPSVRDAYIYHIDGALPRVALFHKVAAAANGDQALSAIVAPGFDFRATAVVEGVPPTVSGDARGDSVQLIARNAERVEADVKTGSSALLLQNDTWYPGWKATVDGRDSPVLVADYLFRGVAVPAGHHRVVIAYRSTAVLVGLTLSSLGIVLLLGMLFWERLRGLIFPRRERVT